MSLTKQLSTATLAVMLILLFGSLYLMSNSSRNMLLNQLKSHSQDAATHLGLYLAPAIASKDVTTIKTSVNAIFDTGYYQRIEILDATGNTLFSKSTPARLDEQIPDWFIALIEIDPPEMTQDVSHQWNKIGFVRVQSRAGYAYDKLWSGIQNTLYLFGLLAVLAAIAVGSLLFYILRPLKGVEEQASALSEKRFVQQEQVPRTRELRQVVSAMNKMVDQVRLMFDEQNRHIDELRRTAYQDNLTGLPNQRALDARLSERLDHRKDFGRGALIYLRIANLNHLNKELGTEKASNFIKVVSRTLDKIAHRYDQAVLGRISGADFVLLISRPTANALHQLLTQLSADINANHTALTASPLINQHWPVHIGIAYCNDQTGTNQVMSEARLALQKAEQNDEPFVVYNHPKTQPDTPSAWHQHIADTVNKQEIFLERQPLVSHTNAPAQQELLVRILDNKGTPCSAGEFLSVIKELGLIETLDRVVIELALIHIQQNPTNPPLAINLSGEALQSKEFITWFSKTINQCAHPEKLHIELSESTALNNLSNLTTFRAQLRDRKITFGVDNFGIHPAGFSYLYSLQPDYIKIDGSLIRQIDQRADDRFYVSSLISIAHSLSIQAYAEHVERETQLFELTQLNIDGTQGWLHGHPTALAQHLPPQKQV